MDDEPDRRVITCPGCGAVAVRNEELGYLETAHELDCSWMADPDSECYG